MTDHDLRFARCEAVSALASTFIGLPPDRAWRRASYQLWLKWLDRRGDVDLEGSPRGLALPVGVSLPWLVR